MPRDVSPASPMTGAILRELLAQHRVVKSRMNPPSRAARVRLATLIDALFIDFMRVDANRHRLSLIQAELIKRLGGPLEELCEEMRRPPANPLVGVDLHRIEGDVAAAEQVIAAIQVLRERSFFQAREPRRNRKGAEWPSYAAILAVSFIEAMKETNPGVDLALGDDGPVSRFIATVVPFITGERPKPATIARHLQNTREATRNVRAGLVASNIGGSNFAD
jgi:hypothetical protein